MCCCCPGRAADVRRLPAAVLIAVGIGWGVVEAVPRLVDRAVLRILARNTK